MSEFVHNLSDVFKGFGPIVTKRMFGGHGVYHDGLMFGLVADDVLYLKADKKSVEAFTRLGLRPFEYEKQGARIKLSYYQAPDVLFEDPSQAKAWAEQAFAAALRGRKPKPRK